MAIDAMGLSTDEIKKRLTAIGDAWDLAAREYAPRAILMHTAQDIVGLLAGAIAMILAGALVILIGNVGGAAIGGALGAMAGGAGAVPGAAAGRLVGNYVAQGFLQLLGVGMLIGYIGSELIGIGNHFWLALDTMWNAADFGGETYESYRDFAARHMAEGVGKFFGALVMALVILLTRRPVEERTKILNSKLMKICDGLEIYLIRNLRTLETKYKGGLLKATVTEGLPATPEEVVAGKKASAMAALKPFGDMPSFYRQKPSALRSWLKSNHFVKVSDFKAPGQMKANGKTANDYTSEIWMRQRSPGGEIGGVVRGSGRGVVSLTRPARHFTENAKILSKNEVALDCSTDILLQPTALKFSLHR